MTQSVITPSSSSPTDWMRRTAGSLNPLLTQFLYATAQLSYTSNASKLLRVNSTEDGVELAALDTANITANAVTYAKFQQVAASSLVGNPTGSLANAQAITLVGGLTFSGTTLGLGAITPTSTTVSGKIVSTSATAGVGYATGAGGTITQLTSKATAVTKNAACGEITMNNAALAAATTVSFTLTNSAIAATDNLLINHVLTGTIGLYLLNAVCGAGSAVIYVRNTSGGSLSEAIKLRFTVLKGATS